MHALNESVDTIEAANGIAVLKIDTEGSEQEVLAGAAQLLRDRHIRGMIIEVSPCLGSVDYLNDLLSPASGMTGYAIETKRRMLRNHPALRPLVADTR